MPALKLVLTWLLALMFVLAAPARAANIDASFRAHNGQFVKAIEGGGGPIIADAPQALTWERFTLVDVNGGNLQSGDAVGLRTLTGHFVTADRNTATWRLVADRRHLREWETLLLYQVDLSGNLLVGTVRDGDLVALAINDGGQTRFVTAEGGGGAVLNANRMWVREWERFRLVLRGAPDPIRLSAPFADPAAFARPVGFDHDSRSGWCHNHRGQGAPACYDGHRGIDFPLIGGPIAQDRGFEVLAATAGYVVSRQDGFPDDCTSDLTQPGATTCSGNAANLVAIRQDDGRIAYYYHLRRGSVRDSVGQRVECGHVLGQAGSSGDSSAPHLHFEMLPALTALQEVNTSFGLFAVRALMDSIDPYRSALWADLSPNDVPRRQCPGEPRRSGGLLPTCSQDVSSLVCDDSRHTAICSAVPRWQHGSVCVNRRLNGSCKITCADSCNVQTRSVDGPCPP